MSKFSWYTIVHPDYEGWPAPPLYRLVGPAIEESGETTCDIYFKPNRKGGHTHFHSFNASVRKNDRRKIKLKFKKALLVAEFTNIMCQCLGLDPLYGLDPKIINRINQIKKKEVAHGLRWQEIRRQETAEKVAFVWVQEGRMADAVRPVFLGLD